MTGKITKARTKGQRKRARQKISLAGGEEAAARPTGRDRRHTNQPQEDARRVALSARIRVHGIAKDDVTSPLCTSGVDRCIMAITRGQERADITEAWLRLITAQHNYRTRILGLTGYPQGAAIAMMPEAMQTDTSHSIDIRTAAERDAAASRAWSECQTAIASLPSPHFIWAIRNAMTGGMDGAGGDVWRDGMPTARGVLTVNALRMMCSM